MQTNSLPSLIEAILFMKGEPVLISDLAEYTQKTAVEIDLALLDLESRLESARGGTRLLRKDGSALLVTSIELKSELHRILKSERTKDLGRAGLETLAIVLYRGPVSKAKIEYIRGVNSAFVIRGLLIRGLIEKVSNPDDQRGYLYRPTLDALAHLGVTDLKELPEYAVLSSAIDAGATEDTLDDLNETDQ